MLQQVAGPSDPPGSWLPVMKCHFPQLRAAAFFCCTSVYSEPAGVEAGSAPSSALLTLPRKKSELKRCA